MSSSPSSAASPPSYSSSSLLALLDRLARISLLTLDDNTNERKSALRQHPMRPALFDVLCNVKEKTALSLALRREPEIEQESKETVLLDNMLAAEGVVIAGGLGQCCNPDLPVASSSSSSDHSEYKAHLVKIRVFYDKQLCIYESSCAEFTAQVRQLLIEQSWLRPVSSSDIDRMSTGIQLKFSRIQVELKQAICQAVMALKSRFQDNRRKRRNFCKKSTEVLNAYFEAHIANPYPSEETKEELARACNITVSQVSNWFGNKRIRYKKQIAKAYADKGETRLSADMMTSYNDAIKAAAASEQYGLLTAGSSGGMLPHRAYQPSELQHFSIPPPPFNLASFYGDPSQIISNHYWQQQQQQQFALSAQHEVTPFPNTSK